MALKQALLLLCGVTAVFSGIALGYEFIQWNQIRAYNAAVQNSDFIQASSNNDGPRGQFALAYNEQQQGRYQEARVIYGVLEKLERNDALLADVIFNMGNTYLRQASTLDPVKDADRLLPLVELAKESYRKLLALDSQHWDAKYNLERALQRLPDVEKVTSQKSEGAIRTVRTTATASSEDNLP